LQTQAKLLEWGGKQVKHVRKSQRPIGLSVKEIRKLCATARKEKKLADYLMENGGNDLAEEMYRNVTNTRA